MSYLAVKHIHITCAALSGILFFTRGIWMLRDSAMLQRPWVNTSAHVVETILLISAVTMVVWSAQYPFVLPWLTVKLGVVVAYVLLGTVAIRRGGTKTARVTAFIIALLLFGYILKLALTRQLM
jgi:uncharacterized membrane protein SirB2